MLKGLLRTTEPVTTLPARAVRLDGPFEALKASSTVRLARERAPVSAACSFHTDWLPYKASTACAVPHHLAARLGSTSVLSSARRSADRAPPGGVAR